MIISHRKKFIFFHIGKTGGTTVETRLIDYHEDSPGFLCFNPDRYTVHSHLNHTYFSRSDETLNMLTDYFTFCFVRNPYDFLYSVFRQWIKTALIGSCDFDAWLTSHEFVDSFNRYSLPHVANGKRLRDGFMHFYTHRGNMCIMDFIGKVEFFEYEFKNVCDIVGLDYDIRLNANILTEPIDLSPETVSLTSGRCYKYLDKYSQAAVEIVNAYFKRDFELFRYPTLDPNVFAPRVGRGQDKPSPVSGTF